ncbi:MAG: glycerol-3-phosphate 1-O-acyltransferase PlsY [Bacteroidota bacterium]
MLALTVVILLSYLLGSIPSSIWVGRIYKGIDIREHGSGNPGTTNTFRMLGWKAGVVVGLIDLFKGFISAYYISQLAYSIGSGPVTISAWDLDSSLQIIAGVAAVVGHMFPLYAKFNGGKGVLTAAGMLYAIEPISISISLLIFIVILFSSRYVSLASIISSGSYPLWLVVLRYGFDTPIDGSIIIFGTILGLGIVIKHHSNISRLMKGTENRVRSFSPAKGRLNKQENESV